jgi:HSP20 family protein
MATLQVYDPFGDSQLDELVRGILRPIRNDRTATPVAIKVDVKETEKGYTVHAEIPGVKKEDIHVAVEGNQVTIAAEVKRENEAKDGERVLRSERYYGNVYRSFTLPADLDEDASEAKYDNGVLELKLAKKIAVPGRKLTIQ